MDTFVFSMLYTVLCGFVLVLCGIANAGNICLSCDEAVVPIACTTISRCANHEVCFTEMFVNTVGAIRYRLGCRDARQCSTSMGIRDNPWNKHRRQADIISEDQTVVCSECCQGLFCNHAGCNNGGYPVRSARGPICFSCVDQANTHDCDKIMECSRGHVCMLKKKRVGRIMEYESRCEEKAKCEEMLTSNEANQLIGKRYMQSRVHGRECEVQCCDEDVCNDGTNCTTTSTMILTSLIPIYPTRHSTLPTTTDTVNTWSEVTQTDCSGPLSDSEFHNLSGIAASRVYVNPQLFYLHNSGPAEVPTLFVVDRNGGLHARFQFTRHPFIDWQDIAVGPCPTIYPDKSCIYFVDSGNSTNFPTIYYRQEQVGIPHFADLKNIQFAEELLGPFKLSWHGRVNALMVDPNAIIYLVSSQLELIKVSPNWWTTSNNISVTNLGRINIPETVLTADMSRNGAEVLVRTNKHYFYWNIGNSTNIDAMINGQSHMYYPLHRAHQQGRGVCWDSSGSSFYLASIKREKREICRYIRGDRFQMPNTL